MSRSGKRTWKRKASAPKRDGRIEVVRVGMLIFAIIIALRLFSLQILDHGFYQALASGQHEIFRELFPQRGDIAVRDIKDGTLVPIATNQRLWSIYADPRHIDDAEEAAEEIGKIFGYEEEQIERLERRLDQPDDPYEPIEKHVSDQLAGKIDALELAGILRVGEEVRLYPEDKIGGHVIGFVGANEDGSLSGKYGIEGFFEEELAGKQGFIRSERDIAGRLIAVGDTSIQRAEDGSDVVLTIDRNIQYFTCGALRRAVERHDADGGSVIILEPATGAVLAMCGAPDFDPNVYREVASVSVFNNPAVFGAYEPGSIFKPITIAAGLDTGALSPSTTYMDTGEEEIDEFTIRNSDKKAHGITNISVALEQSLNLGMIFAMRETGMDKFVQYVKSFGFGQRTGIELDTESRGDISPLDKGYEIYAATASFGQGITVTPLQMAAAYVAIANGGVLKRPYIVQEIRHPDGTIDSKDSEDIRRVIEPRTARLLGAMLISVIENGHGGDAGVDGYYIAGKTGTAQVARTDGRGYREGVTVGSFAGFGPVEDPKFVMITRIDHPKDTPWASETAAPLFGEIADYLLRYFEVSPTR